MQQLGKEGVTSAGGYRRQLVWDLPTRIFHWLLILFLGFSWWSAENHRLDLHQYSGIVVVALLVFRLLWGIFGTSTARFGQFVRGPRTVWSYLRSSSPPHDHVGHNPLGGWSVLLMLALLIVQVVTGVFSVDVDGIESGPLAHLIDFDQGRAAAAVHGFNFTALLVAVSFHVLAIIFYLAVRRRNLIGPMVTGFQNGADAPGRAVLVPRWRVAVAVLLAALFSYGVWNGFRVW